MFSTSSNKDLGGFKIIISQLLFIIRKKYWKGLLLFIGFFMTWVALMLYGIFSDNKKTELIKSDMGLVEGTIVDKIPGIGKSGGDDYGVEFVVNNRKFKTYFFGFWGHPHGSFLDLKVLVAYKKDSIQLNQVLRYADEFTALGLDDSNYTNYLNLLNESVSTPWDKIFNAIILVFIFSIIFVFIFYKIYLVLQADLEELNRDGGV